MSEKDPFDLVDALCTKAREDYWSDVNAKIKAFCMERQIDHTDCVLLEHTAPTLELCETQGMCKLVFKYKLMTRREYEEYQSI